MARITKKDIYAEYGIRFEDGKIFAPIFGFIPELLIDGNSKIGKGVYHFSMLPGTETYTATVNGVAYECQGTCNCDCSGCYAKTGRYNCDTPKQSNLIKSMLARYFPDFVKNAVIAQIKANHIELCRIHASGDFVNDEYIAIWRDITKACPECTFWSYTKNAKAESAFDDIPNCNIVKSIIPNCGLNFGHCDYILKAYQILKNAGKSVYVCRCGIDNNQHCNTCKGCSKNEYVLFIEHSTDYRAKKDASYPELKALIESQPKA